MKRKISLLFILLAFGAVMLMNVPSLFANGTRAYLVENVEPERIVKPRNSLVISANAPHNDVKVNRITGSQYDTFDKVPAGSPKMTNAESANLDSYKSKIISNMDNSYAATTIVLENLTSSNRFQIIYPNIGTYNDKEIGVIVTFEDMVYKRNNQFNFDKALIQLSHNLHSGF